MKTLGDKMYDVPQQVRDIDDVLAEYQQEIGKVTSGETKLPYTPRTIKFRLKWGDYQPKPKL